MGFPLVNRRGRVGGRGHGLLGRESQAAIVQADRDGSALFERAEEEAIRVFGANLKDLLLAAPAGPKAVIGLDPGIRTGVKVAVVDLTGKLPDTATIYPHEPRNDRDGALRTFAPLAAGAPLARSASGPRAR